MVIDVGDRHVAPNGAQLVGVLREVGLHVGHATLEQADHRVPRRRPILVPERNAGALEQDLVPAVRFRKPFLQSLARRAAEADGQGLQRDSQ
ncbi:hypothetical protein [Roseovarius sp.]|uniref:hypothetical protein n=1 Tax=Roseovarius sp. TaxID=1486281 RepID=UPI003BA856CD